MRMKKGLILCIFVLLVINTAYASEDFTAAASSALSACACGAITNAIMLENTGTEASDYIISKEGSASQWASYSASFVRLDPGQKETIYNFITLPCRTSGSYMLKTYFTTSKGISKLISQAVNANECANIELSAQANSFRNCACTPTLYTLNLKNTGSFIETYTLSIDLPQNYYTFSEKKAILAAGEQRTIFLYVTLPCDYSESYVFNVQAIAQSTGQAAALPLYLVTDLSCYDYDVHLGKEIAVIGDEVAYKYENKKDSNYSLCANTSILIPIKLENKGKIFNYYTLSVKPGYDWMILSNKTYPLWGFTNATANLFVVTSPEEIGYYEFSLYVDAERGNLEAEKSFTVDVQACGSEPVKITQKTKIILAIIGALILLFLLLLIILLIVKKYRKSKEETSGEESYVEGIEEEKEEEMKESKKAEKEEEFVEEPEDAEKHKRRNIFLFMIVLALILILVAAGIYYNVPSKISKYFNTTNAAEQAPPPQEPPKASEPGFFAKLKNKIKSYFNTTVNKTTEFKPVEALSKKYPDVNLSKENEYILSQKQEVLNRLKNLLNEEKDETKKAEYTLRIHLLEQDIEELVNPNPKNADIVESFTYRAWDMDTNYTIDLTKHFKDIDELEYSSSEVENIKITINDGTATLIPDKHWHGTRTVVFTASDGKSSTSTPEITLLVREKELPAITKIKDNMYYIILGLIILILLIALIVVLFKKRPKKIIVKKKRK